MATLGISFKAAKRSFINTRRLLDAQKRGRARPLVQFGALVKTVARNSIKRPGASPQTKTSRPGQPPRGPTGLLKRTIFFVYDPRSESVVIGPVKLSGRTGIDVPSVLEYGGVVRTRGIFRRRNRQQKSRPFMTPAFDKVLPKAENLFANSIS